MARKGKEPAGLRRYRLEQKRKKAKRSRGRTSKPRKAKSMARRRRYGRRRGSRRSKKTVWKLAKGLIYTGSVAAPAYANFKHFTDSGLTTSQAALATLEACAGYNYIDKKFDMKILADQWTPVAIVAVVDFATTKLPIQSKISRGINNLLG